jgi:dTMP kinase
MSGHFIVVEGGEGSGKSSLLVALRERFGDQRFLFTREPGGTTLAERIRELLFSREFEDDARTASGETTLLLMWAARSSHVERLIVPALARGVSVVSDRFDPSSWVYNVRAQQCNDCEVLFEQLRALTSRHVRPSLYIYLDIDPQVGLARRGVAGVQNHFDLQSIEFHERVRAGYREFFKRFAPHNHIIIDAAQSQQMVAQEAIRAIEALY